MFLELTAIDGTRFLFICPPQMPVLVLPCVVDDPQKGSVTGTKIVCGGIPGHILCRETYEEVKQALYVARKADTLSLVSN